MSRGLIPAIFYSRRAVEALVIANWVDYAPIELHPAPLETTLVAGNAFSSGRGPNARKQKKWETNAKRRKRNKKKGEKGKKENKPFLARAKLPS